MKLVDIYHRKIHYDYCFTNDGDIKLYNNWRKQQVLEVWATTKFHKRQNDRKGRYTMAPFRENWKKVKIEVTGPKKVSFGMCSDKLTKNDDFPFLWPNFFLKCA